VKGATTVSDLDVATLFDSLDTDDSGKIDVHEFLRAALGRPSFLFPPLHF
jgi:Ca2+-binding EF-hand superfamily protein